MILCHKCSGLLGHGDSEDASNLFGCSCISGYIRDFQVPITRHAAIKEQVSRAASSIQLYIGQGRELSDPIFASTLKQLTTVMSVK